MIDLTPALKEVVPNPERVFGRYYVSDLYAITHGLLTPENFSIPRQLSISERFAMWQGGWKHRQTQELLEIMGFAVEVKKELAHKDFELVGKVDALDDKQVIEIKTSAMVFSKAKEWHNYQTKVYCSLFDRPKGLICQPVVKDRKIYLKVIGQVRQDDRWFNEQLKKLALFHEKLVS